MPRIARVVAEGYPHHITQRGNNRQEVFFDDEDRAVYVHLLRGYCRKCGVTLWAYCLMPNHVHLLAVPEEADSLSRCIGRTNLLYTQHANRKYGRSGRLWQNRYFSTVVDKDEYVWAVMRYIEKNPVKGGIVKQPEQYRWSSCRANVTGRGDDLVSGKGWLDESQRKDYRKMLKQQDGEMDERIRLATSTGRPLGSEGFVKKIERKLSRKLLPSKAGRPQKNTTRK